MKAIYSKSIVRAGDGRLWEVNKASRARVFRTARVMYFPTSVASQLCTVPALPSASEEPVLDITPSARKSLFCALTASSIQLWRVRVRDRILRG